MECLCKEEKAEKERKKRKGTERRENGICLKSKRKGMGERVYGSKGDNNVYTTDGKTGKMEGKTKRKWKGRWSRDEKRKICQEMKGGKFEV